MLLYKRTGQPQNLGANSEMFCLSKPTREVIDAFISAQRAQPFSYPGIGSTRGKPPRGYNVDHNRIRLGQGRDAFARARRAIHSWKMFGMPWTEMCWPDTPVEINATVAVLAFHFGFWSLNACRIVYLVEELGSVEKHGFAYGTLQGHAEFGEERFTVEYDQGDQSVWYDLYAFSRPGFAARLGYPFSRALQRRFARDSKAAMLRAAVSP